MHRLWRSWLACVLLVAFALVQAPTPCRAEPGAAACAVAACTCHADEMAAVRALSHQFWCGPSGDAMRAAEPPACHMAHTGRDFAPAERLWFAALPQAPPAPALGRAGPRPIAPPRTPAGRALPSNERPPRAG